MNIWDIVILGIVAGGVILAVMHTRKNRKNGKCPGGFDCCGKPCKLKLDTDREA